jgi:hypothetical protein
MTQKRKKNTVSEEDVISGELKASLGAFKTFFFQCKIFQILGIKNLDWIRDRIRICILLLTDKPLSGFDRIQ